MRQQADTGKNKPAYKIAVESLNRLRGNAGLPVTNLQWLDAQRRLNMVKGGPVIAMDGIPGKETEHAVAYFQSLKGLLVTGQMNDKTYKALLDSTI